MRHACRLSGCIVGLTAAVLLACTSEARADEEWSAGDAINTPVISSPAANSRYGLSTRVLCQCNQPTDSDHWTDGCDSGDEADPTVAASWSDGGAGGFFSNNGTGTEVWYTTPSSVGEVTLTLTFDDTGVGRWNDSPPTPDHVTIIVMDAKMIFKVDGNETSEVTRAEAGSFEVVDGNGDPISGATYSNWAFDGEIDVSDPSHTSRTWGGTIVQGGSASCSVTFGGYTCSVSKDITCNPRTGWSIAPTCAPDNESTWGAFPNWDTGCVYGRLRDEERDIAYIIVPRDGDDYSGGYTRAEVSSGPNEGVWYISASTLKIDMETVINRYAKSGTTPLTPPGTNFHEYNESQSVDADGMLAGLQGHEYKGRFGNEGEGHFAFLEDKEAETGMDAKAAIEDNIASNTDTLKTDTDEEISDINDDIYAAAAVEPTGNWSGGPIYEYSFNNAKWYTKPYSN